MPGNTAAINFATLRVQWDSHSSMAAICSYWTISKDQLIRLRDVLPLPKRHDRRYRVKPARQRDPTTTEILQACLDIQAGWDDATRAARAGHKPEPLQLRVVPLPEDMVDDIRWEASSGEPG